MKKNIIKLSVVVPTHGRVKLFEETLKSLYYQNCKDFEVIISDDSPLIEDRDEIKKLVSLYQHKGMIIKYIFTKPNILQAPNTNQGLKAASGSYIRILHSDDLISPQCIGKEIEFFEKNPEVDFLYHCSIAFSKQLDFVAEQEDVNVNLYKSNVWLDRSIFTHTVLPSCLCFRSSLLSHVKGMDESYKFLCDWQLFFDFLMDSYEKDKSFCCFSAGHVGWRMHEESVSSTLFIEHFLEHERFISNIIEIYKRKRIVSKRKLKQNIYDATKYRYSRLLNDLKKYKKNRSKFIVYLHYLSFLLSRKYGIVHCLLKLVFIPSQIIRMLSHFIYQVIFEPKSCIEKIEKKLAFLWK